MPTLTLWQASPRRWVGISRRGALRVRRDCGRATRHLSGLRGWR